MNIHAIARIRVSNTSLKLLLRAAKTLERDKPEKANEPVEQAYARLSAFIVEVEAALAARLRGKNPVLVAREVEFDRATDSLWVFARTVLELTIAAFGHAGLDLLTPERQAEIDLPKLRALATRARALHEQLFAAEGTAFTQTAFPLQAESMATLLRVIEEDALGDDLTIVVGELLGNALVVCQAQYEEMVDERMRREIGVSQDFHALRGRLRWLIDRCKTAIETLYDEDDPDSERVVSEALRALIVLDAHARRAGGRAAEAELDEILVDAEIFDELDEAVAEAEQAEGDSAAE
jgi:hypothetical protein